MNYTTTTAPRAEGQLETPFLAGGCTGCWAAGYCAGFAPNSFVQPPPACPLTPGAGSRHAGRR
ncbi:hypothetical protein [Hymenobacter arcticus]